MTTLRTALAGVQHRPSRAPRTNHDRRVLRLATALLYDILNEPHLWVADDTLSHHMAADFDNSRPVVRLMRADPSQPVLVSTTRYTRYNDVYLMALDDTDICRLEDTEDATLLDRFSRVLAVHELATGHQDLRYVPILSSHHDC